MDNNLSVKNYFYDKDKSFSLLYEKTNRLISALFLVIGSMPDLNEIKQRIKNLALETLSLSIELKDISVSKNKDTLKNLDKKILEIVSLLDIASVSGEISEMNASILKNEFKFFIDSVSELLKIVDNENYDFLRETMSQVNKAHGDLDLKKEKAVENPSLKDNNQRQSRKETRRGAIFEFVKANPGSNIRDIYPNIKGCGEKTIQRELLELIKVNRIKRTGDRRWSRYSIA